MSEREISFLASKIYELYGTVKRARGAFLYTAKRVRLTDLYQEGGRAILGWGGSSAFTVFKDILSRGANGSFSTDYSPRLGRDSKKSQLSKALSTLLNSNRAAYFFPTKSAALSAALKISPNGTSVWKPWTGADVKFEEISCVLLEPPLAWASGIWILAILQDDSEENSGNQEIENLFSVPAPLAGAVTRSIYNLIAAVQERSEKDWFIYDKVLTKYWTRKGPYLFPKVPKGQYEDFILHCLKNEVVVSPEYECPSIVPFGANPGVFAKLQKNPFEFSSDVSESTPGGKAD